MKVLKVSDLRALEAQVNNKEISYSRMVEIINEMTAAAYHKKFDKLLQSEKKDDECMARYRIFHDRIKEASDEINEIENELPLIENGIRIIEKSIIVVRKNQTAADAMVGEYNKKINECNEKRERYQELIKIVAENSTHIKNYDRDNDKELFLYWRMLKEVFPDTPTWIKFQSENADWYYRNRLKK